ncbi:uncharacterized protein TNCV_4709011 [Trichonephila clavipes]|nr:uncharacterized protein TNCV_4709011 [Trichonephila clavipes]
MFGLSDFQRGQIVRTRLAGESVTETSQFLEVSRGNMSKVMTAYTQCNNTSLAKQNSERKEKLSERDRQVMKRIVTSKKQTTAANVSAELYQHQDSPVSIITVRKHLHKQNIYGRTVITKPLVTDVNAKCRRQWCHTHKTWSIDKWKKGRTTGGKRFLESKDEAYVELSDDAWLMHLDFVFDITLNELNLKLQGKNQTTVELIGFAIVVHIGTFGFWLSE